MKAMTSFIFLFVCFIFLGNNIPISESHLMEGAWETTTTGDDGEQIKITTIVKDGYFASTSYNKESKIFFNTFGGRYTLKDSKFIYTTDFNSDTNVKIGETITSNFIYEDGKLTMDTNDLVWTMVDNGDKSSLSGAWFFAGRMNNGEMSRRALGPRKTMKILSDTRFQWIAYNDETGGFFGTGGGTYTNLEGKYVENIEFFSRDSSRVGATLSFDFEIKDEEWHHSGFSSKGDPMYEIWAPYEKIEKVAE